MPQIRFSGRDVSSDAVVMRASVSEPIASPSRQSPSDFSAADVSPSSYLRVEAEPNTRRTAGLDRPTALRSALNVGAMAGVLSLLPLGLIVALPLAGYLGVRLYRRRSLGQELSRGAGFKLGALCGAFTAVIFSVLRTAMIAASPAGGELRQAMNERILQSAANNPNPQVHRVAVYLTSPQGLPTLMILGFVFTLVLFVLLSGLGGAISATLFRRKGR